MKAIFSLLLLFIGFNNLVIAQSRQTYNAPMSTYVKPDFNALRQSMEATQKNHDNNRTYKDYLQDLVYNIRRNDKQNDLKAKLDGFQKELDYLESRGDWANLGNDLRRIENGIKRMISDYEESLKNVDVSREKPTYSNPTSATTTTSVKADKRYEDGWESFNNESYGAARAYFSILISEHPNDYRGYFGRATTKLAEREFSESIEDLNKAISLNSQFSMSFNNRAWAYFNLNQYEKALIDVNEAIRLNGSNIAALDTRAEVYLALGKYQESIDDCKKALSLNPNISNSYLIMGKANYSLGNKTAACTNFRKAKEMNLEIASSYLKEYCL